MQIHLDIKPLSVNDAWKGKRFKTKQYQTYEKSVLWLLPKFDMPAPPYHIDYEFGMSNILSDLDNPVKPLMDILQKKYAFNDSFVHSMHVKKVKVEKGKEYAKVNIITYTT